MICILFINIHNSNLASISNKHSGNVYLAMRISPLFLKIRACICIGHRGIILPAIALFTFA